jgi:uncharacterized protein involved in exopolysaccharide biosynthesis
MAFKIAYEYWDPQIAQRVAADLTSLYISLADEERLKRTEAARSFLEEEARQIENGLIEAEHKLADFRAANVGSLPEHLQYNVSLIDRAEQELRNLDVESKLLRERQQGLEAQLATISPYKSFTVGDQTVLGPTDKMQLLQLELAQLSTTYGPQHPKVLERQQQIKELQRLLNDSKTRPDSRSRMHADNPAYVQVSTMLNATRTQLEVLAQRREELKKKIAEHEPFLIKSSAVEARYAELQREYDNSKASLNSIRGKALESGLRAAMEKQGEGERMVVVESPVVPDRPVKPHRLIILVAGIVFSFASGVAAAALRERLSPLVYTDADIRKLTGKPPLAVVPAGSD